VLTRLGSLRVSRTARFVGAPPFANASLSLHDALPISRTRAGGRAVRRAADRPRSGQRAPCRSPEPRARDIARRYRHRRVARPARSEEHTSELQSREKLVCRLLLEKKKTYQSTDDGRRH